MYIRVPRYLNTVSHRPIQPIPTGTAIYSSSSLILSYPCERLTRQFGIVTLNLVEDTPYHVALREALKPIREPVNLGRSRLSTTHLVARHPTSTRIRQSGYGQNPASGQKQITRREHHLDHNSSRGVESPGRTHRTVEVAPDNLPLLPGWSAPVRAEKWLRMIHRGASF